MTFKLIIAGSRSIKSYDDVRQAVIESGWWKEYKHDIEVVSGTATGVDKLGEMFAERNGLLCTRFPADWDTHGKKAGHLRNCEMGRYADGLVAVWDGRSRGTDHMIRYMRSLQKDVYVKEIANG